MQIRYLDTMAAMARSANSKVIFMPGTVEPALVSGTGDMSGAIVSPLQQSITAEMTGHV